MTHPISRRCLLKAGGTAGAGLAVSAMLPATARAATFTALGFPTPGDVTADPIRDDAHVKRLAIMAVEAARKAGATYADVRLIREHRRTVYVQIQQELRVCIPSARETLTIGVRALTGGAWGFAASTAWTEAEATRVGTEAALEAKITTAGGERIALAPIPTVASGHWTMPVEVDPTDVPWTELLDFSQGVAAITQKPVDFGLYKWDRVFASSEGAYATQTTYRASAGGSPCLSDPDRMTPPLTVAGAGWEYLRNHPYIEQRRAASEWWSRVGKRTITEPALGRYPAVISAELVASIASATIGRAAELDRMLGYRANDQGTSYLDHPADMLGRYVVGSPAVTVTADRTAPGACATVKWDDEGVAAGTYPLIEKGVLANCITTRETAAWLASNAPQHRDAGVARAALSTGSDVEPPETSTPNLTITPGTGNVSLTDMCATIDRGYIVFPGKAYLDHQQLSGIGFNMTLVEIRKGRLAGTVPFQGSVLFRSAEFWKNVRVCGGAKSAVAVGIEYGSPGPWGIPQPTFAHSVSAVPVLLESLAFIRSPGGQ